MDFLFGYNENKIKPYLKMAVQRIQIASNKKSIAVKHQKREIAQLLADKKDEKARIKVEHIIREDFLIEAYEMLELLLELIHERIKQVTTSKEVPPDLKEAVCSLIWAASNVDISEFAEIKNQLTKKYGSDFAKAAENNEANCVNARLFNKLTYKPPSTKLVMGYLVEIAKGYQVEWDPVESGLPEGGIMSDQPLSSPVGFSVPMAPASGISGAYSRTAQQQAVVLTPEEIAEQEQFRRNQIQNANNNNNNVVVATPMPLEHQQSPRYNLSAMPPPSNSNNGKGGNNNDGDGGGVYIPPYQQSPQQQQFIPTANVVSIENSSSSSSTGTNSAAPSAPPNAPSPPVPTDAPALSFEARLAALHKRN